MIQLVELCRYYRRAQQEIRAVDQVSLALEKGSFVSLVGASGSGKSTLLNLIAGLDTPTGGAVVVDGQDIYGLSRRDRSNYRARRVGMIFQSFNLVSHLSALDNVSLGLMPIEPDRKRRRERAASTLGRLGLADRLEHRPADLSGGEQQRVAIARAVAKEPELLLADEPTGNLDRDNTNAVADILHECHASGLTVIMASHDLALAGRLSQRIFRLDYGRLAGEETQ